EGSGTLPVGRDEKIRASRVAVIDEIREQIQVRDALAIRGIAVEAGFVPDAVGADVREPVGKYAVDAGHALERRIGGRHLLAEGRDRDAPTDGRRDDGFVRLEKERLELVRGQLLSRLVVESV